MLTKPKGGINIFSKASSGDGKTAVQIGQTWSSLAIATFFSSEPSLYYPSLTAVFPSPEEALENIFMPLFGFVNI